MRRLEEFLSRHRGVVRVVLTRVRGSSPREAGTEMFVADTALHGTIGGGQLEYIAVDRARTMLTEGMLTDNMDVPLGPEIGQCCGGRVEMTLTRIGRGERRAAILRAEARDLARPHVFILGAGHVGRALADLMQHLPVQTILVDPRAEELTLCRADVETRLTPLPEAEIATAPEGSAFIVLTHDHALDFLLASEALKRGDAAYVGLIGSSTKRGKFDHFCRDHCDGLSTDALVCPIGAQGSSDKRPAVIAAFVAAEVMARLTENVGAIAPSRRPARPGAIQDVVGKPA